jgi:nicotinamidase-related amidase
VVICGYTSFLCCDSTARQAFELGYDVLYVEDAINEFPLDGLDQATVHSVVSAVQGVMFSEVLTTGAAVERLGA